MYFIIKCALNHDSRTKIFNDEVTFHWVCILIIKYSQLETS